MTTNMPPLHLVVNKEEHALFPNVRTKKLGMMGIGLDRGGKRMKTKKCKHKSRHALSLNRVLLIQLLNRVLLIQVLVWTLNLRYKQLTICLIHHLRADQSVIFTDLECGPSIVCTTYKQCLISTSEQKGLSRFRILR